MQKRQQRGLIMSAKKTESLHFYDYLCRKIGSEKDVKVRRLTFVAADIAMSLDLQISSGSKSEGLDLNGSDIDVMFVNLDFIVYESERDAVNSQKAALVMDTENTQPCFTRLHTSIHTPYNMISEPYRIILEQYENNYMMRSDRYKDLLLQVCNVASNMKIHGPCLSDNMDNFDMVWCLRCDKWISAAVPWIDRPRSSWLSPDIISKITMSGVLFVPIGFKKGSKYEHLEWRISFSVAEKFLIFTFNHTQLLCYALLKIVLKEIIEKEVDLSGLLCSYYIKTLMFWILDDTDPAIWRPDNIIKCFNTCLRRLIYNVESSTLLHYFIPDLNYFDLHLSAEFEKKKKLTSILKNIYQQGIQCFSASKTLHLYTRFPTEINAPLNINSIIVHNILQVSCSILFVSDESTTHKLLNRLLHHSKSKYGNAIFLYYLSRAYQYVANIPYIQRKPTNKQRYHKYKYDISRLLIGLNTDAISWLMLASFFYVHGNYYASLKLINYALPKITDGKCALFSGPSNAFPPKQEHSLLMMKNEKLITLLKSMTINYLRFALKSQIIPNEIQQDVTKCEAKLHPLTFGHFLRFLCYYRLQDYDSCLNALQQLDHANEEILLPRESRSMLFLPSCIFLGIAEHMMGENERAKSCFEFIAEIDTGNITTAVSKLNELR